jgi:hypothetical protein|mmetsp:Transcript_60816/g.100629  ORF Transcript_60816/g.100629 Transcript_60816/m.100629 type:complete len:80 (-) Transcript_60816:130-369(-)
MTIPCILALQRIKIHGTSWFCILILIQSQWSSALQGIVQVRFLLLVDKLPPKKDLLLLVREMAFHTALDSSHSLSGNPA